MDTQAVLDYAVSEQSTRKTDRMGARKSNPFDVMSETLDIAEIDATQKPANFNPYSDDEFGITLAMVEDQYAI